MNLVFSLILTMLFIDISDLHALDSCSVQVELNNFDTSESDIQQFVDWDTAYRGFALKGDNRKVRSIWGWQNCYLAAKRVMAEACEISEVILREDRQHEVIHAKRLKWVAIKNDGTKFDEIEFNKTDRYLDDLICPNKVTAK